MNVEASVKDSIYETYRGIPHEDKLAVINDRNLGFTVDSDQPSIKDNFFKAAEEFGFTPVDIDSVYQVLAFVFQRDGVNISAKKSAKKQTGDMVTNTLAQMRFQVGDKGFQIIGSNGEEEEVNLIDVASQSLLENNEIADLAESLSRNDAVVGRVIRELKTFIDTKKGLSVAQTAPNQLLDDGINLLVGSDAENAKPDTKRKSDRLIYSDKQSVLKVGVLREIAYQDAIAARRGELKRGIDDREIQLTHSYDLLSWPRDALMVHLKAGVKEEIARFIESEGFLCDPQDLRYQTLFRLTTFPVQDIFVNGGELEAYLQESGAYSNWRNILRLDPAVIERFEINSDLVKKVIEEQARVIKANMDTSDLPVEEILTPKGIFSEPGWVIQKSDGEVFAVLEEGVTSASDRVRLRFQQIDPDLANKFHQDLHYIHTPRTHLAFGMFVEGEDLPFSVLALDKVDRPYKQNVLIINGFDPRNCLDLTRLYSQPGTPGNTSSSMFKLAFNFIRTNRPETQAVLSSFMPSYASGVSMISGGFKDAVLIKPLSHIFKERDVDGQTAYEFVTKRRAAGDSSKREYTKVPLLPTMELIAPLQEPCYQPLTPPGKFMVEVT